MHIMPNSWWEWGENLDEKVDNLDEKVESLEAENEMLSEKVFCLESNVDFLKKKLNNVLTLLERMQPQESSSNKSDNPWNHKLCPLCRKGYYIERSESSTGHGYCTNKKCRRSRENKERKAESIRGRCEIRKCSFDG